MRGAHEVLFDIELDLCWAVIVRVHSPLLFALFGLLFLLASHIS